MIDELLTKPLVSEQVSIQQLRCILTELDRLLQTEVPGAILEFGCYLGTTSLFIRRLLDARQADHEFHVYDSFTGLPEKTSQDTSPAGEQFKAGELAVSKKQFIHEFHKAHLKPPIIHKNWFSQLTGSDVPSTIAFAFLDGDFYTSIRDSLLLVLPRVHTGSTIMIDDYSREALPGVAKAVQQFLPPQLHDHIRVEHNLGIIRL